MTQLRSLGLGLTGSGVRVGQPEAIDNGGSNWEVNPAATGQPASLFTYTSSAGTATTYPNLVGSESGHANDVGKNFYGASLGVAPGVSGVDNYDATYFYNSLIASGSSISARVVNQSFIFSGQNTTVDRKYDYYVATYGTIFCSGVGNDPLQPPNSPSTSYNAIGVAVDDGTFSSGPTSDGRCKPDITAPGTATSYSTPLVSGVAALMVQAGNADMGGTGTATSAVDPRTVKALMLNGAVKLSGWTHTTTSPLDFHQGAGAVNAYNAYMQLAAGKRAYNASNTSRIPPIVSGSFTALSGWDFNSATTSGTNYKVNHYFFDLNASQGSSFTVTSTLVWNRGFNLFIQPFLNNLDLYLYNSSGTLVASSVSSVDNVEHIFTSHLAPGRYDLEVVKHGAGASTVSESYALAFKIVPDTPLTSIFSVNGSNAVVQFPTIVGHNYRVERSTDLVSWSTLSDGIAGTGSSVQVTDFGVLDTETQQFYRVRVLQ